MLTFSKANKHIVLQFDKEYGFSMEWHEQCGYDKLHIFTGSVKNFEKANRIARFCGPKIKTWTKPFDGKLLIFI